MLRDTFDIPAPCVPSGWHYKWVRIRNVAHRKLMRSRGMVPVLAKETVGLTKRAGRAWVRHRGMTLMKTSRIPVVEDFAADALHSLAEGDVLVDVPSAVTYAGGH